MSGIFSQFAVADETTYSTPVVVNRFFEFGKESINGVYERIDSSGLRSGTRVLRSDRFAINAKGAKGGVELEVQNKGFGILLKHMLGNVVASGAGPFVYTATPGNLTGKSMTVQVGRPLQGSATNANQAFTYAGGKVDSWTLSNSVDQLLMLALDMDFATEDTATALAVPVYATTSELFSFVGGAITFNAGSIPVKDVSVKVNNGLATERYYLRSNSAKKEPLEKSARKIEVDFTADFDSMALYNYVKSLTAAGTGAQFVATWTSPVGSSVAVTVPFLRLNGDTPNVNGDNLLDIKLKGDGLDNGVAAPITVVYTTPDATA